MYNRHLIDYLPPVERDFAEFDAIMTHAEDPEFSSAWEAAENLMNDQFINDATENGVSRWENMLKISPKASETLDERKFTILTRESEQPPFTVTALERQLEALCGEGNFDVIRDVGAKSLSVSLALVAKNNLEDVAVLLDRVVPANMTITINLKYNRHNRYVTYTHEDLQSLTHNSMRNEVE